MSQDVIDQDLYKRTKRLLAPGEIELNGLIVHTEIPGSDDLAMTQLTIDIGTVIAEHAVDAETYVYSGSDDPEFASNQHQGLTLDDDRFVWECQQLLRNGTYDIVFYYEAGADDDAIVATVEEEFDVAVTFVPSPESDDQPE